MTVLVNKTADYSANYVDLEPPISMTGVRGFFVFGANGPLSIKNFGDGGDATIVGAPTWGAQFARFTGPNAYLQTNILQAADMSICAVVKASVAAPAGTVRPCYLSNAIQSGDGLTFFASTGPNDCLAVTTGGSNTVLPQIANANMDVPQFLAARYSATGPTARMKSYTRNMQSTAVTPGGAVVPTAVSMRIGMNYAANLLGPADIAFMCIAHRQFSDAEETTLYAWAQKLMSLRGVVI